MKKFFKRLFLFLLIAFIAIQFFRPDKNIASGPEAFAKDITTVHNVPANVQVILKKACYDCHSNDTRYPWYNNIQPVAWWLAEHVKGWKKGIELFRVRRLQPEKTIYKASTNIRPGEQGGNAFKILYLGA